MRIGAFGEVMLRLTPPEHLLLEQTDTLRMEFTGTGVNLLSNLAHFGLDSALLSTLPATRLGDAAQANLRKLGVGTAYIRQENNHMGSFLVELGYGCRPTQVTYQNRKNSAFSLAKAADYQLDDFIATRDLIHICGISLSLSAETAMAAQELAEKAKIAGKLVCFDFNFRPSLNEKVGQRKLLQERYQKILPYCDLVFGSIRDLVELLTFGKDPYSSEGETKLIQEFMRVYKLTWFAGTQRKTDDHQMSLVGHLYTQKEHYISKPQILNILDRIGAGDAYAAGILLGIAEKWDHQRMLDFSVANAALAHTISGDVPLINRQMVEQYLTQPNENLLR